MRKVPGFRIGEGEEGAISIKTLFVLVLLAASITIIIKIVPVYTEQRQVRYKVEDMANKAAVRNLNDAKINEMIEVIRAEFDLPDGSITLLGHDKNVRVQITYNRTLNFLVTTYVWRVDENIVAKPI